MAGYFNGDQYAQISDSSALTLNAQATVWSFFLKPDSSINQSDFGYFYSHGLPLTGNSAAINFIRGGGGASTPVQVLRPTW